MAKHPRRRRLAGIRPANASRGLQVVQELPGRLCSLPAGRDRQQRQDGGDTPVRATHKDAEADRQLAVIQRIHSRLHSHRIQCSLLRALEDNSLAVISLGDCLNRSPLDRRRPERGPGRHRHTDQRRRQGQTLRQ